MNIADIWTSAGPTLLVIAKILAAVLILYILLRYCRVYVYLSSNDYGVVEKIWSRKGSIKSGLIALDGRAGYQPQTLRTGPHFFLPFLYRVHKQKLITVRTMAYIYARDGQPLPAGQTLARTPPNTNFENARGFLETTGQRGPQRSILREGVYAINTALFVVITDNQIHAIDIGDDKDSLVQIARAITEREGFSPVVLRGEADNLGVVTVHDGPSLDPDDIIAPRVGDTVEQPNFHNSFQDIEAFLAAGGRRGRQEQVITEGTFYINRLFATVEIKPKTIIAIGTVGVVICYIGSKGVDVSGEAYQHGELVEEGHRGVQAIPKQTGKYAINPYARKIEPVPTTNFVLRWIEGRVEDHGYDNALTEIPLITKDAFHPMLPLSAVVHIAPGKAPRIIQRFAGVKLLVDQTIDPMISAFFKDVAQKYTLIELIGKRDELQREALLRMKQRFLEYDLDLLEIMIGTPRAQAGDTAIPNILEQLRARQVAVEQETTYANQRSAAVAKRSLNEAIATAEVQAKLTASMIQIEIANNEGMAALRLQEQTALATLAVGRADAEVIRVKGVAQADATQAQVAAFEGEGADNQLRRIIVENLSDAIIRSQHALVPNVSVRGGAEGGGGNAVDALLAMVTADFSQRFKPAESGAEADPEPKPNSHREPA